MAKWVECFPMVRETWDQSQATSRQRLEKWYLIPPCLTLSNIRYVSRVKWSNPGKGVAPSPTPRCSSYWKGSLLVALDYGRQLYLLLLRLRRNQSELIIINTPFRFVCLIQFWFLYLMAYNEVYTFLKGNSLRVNVITRLEIELVYYNVAVQLARH